MKKYIVIKTTFPAIHYWPSCHIESVSFLKSPHRHLFYATIKFKISHNDRDIEFIDMKRKIDQFITENYREQFIRDKSCEDIAEEIYSIFKASYVSIFEDNENGAEIYE